MNSKQLYVIFTRSNTVLSNLIHIVKGDEYTHAALAFDKNLEYVFSFGRRYSNIPFIGCFRREELNEGLYARHKMLPGLVLELTVTEAEYEQAKKIVVEFLLNNHRYDYNYAGLFGNLLGINGYCRNRFLCSEFVYHVLHQCGVCDLNIPRTLVRPQNLLHIGGRVVYKGDLKRYAACRAPLRELFQPLMLAAF